MTTTSPPPLDQSVVPAEIDRWNWGAFLLNWVWGIGNNTFIALLTFIPFFGLAIPFVLGARGSAWAWRNGRWDSVEHFKRVQRKWAIWGVVLWLVAIAMFGSIFGGAFYALRSSEAHRFAVSKLESNTVAMSALGAPISTGMPSGEISTKDTSGEAKLDFSVTGTKAKGELHVEALKKDGVWSLRVLKLKIDGRDDVIDLLKDSRVEIEAPAGVFAAAA
jgi:Cytochrome oxidase complex assembly protein 1